MSQEPMTDEKAISTLEETDGWYDVTGCYHPHWTKRTPNNEPVLNLDGHFTREELLALVHFHPDNKKEG